MRPHPQSKRVTSRSIRTRLLAGTALILLVIVAALTAGLSRTASRLLEQQTRAQVAQFVDQGARSFDAFLSARRANVDLWAGDSLTISVMRDPALSAVFMPGLSRYLERYAAQEPWIADILLLADGEVRFALSGAPPDAPRTIMHALADGAGIALVPPMGSAPARLALSAPLSDAGRPIRGQSVVLLLDLARMDARLFSDLRPSESGFLALAGPDGAPVVPQGDRDLPDGGLLTESRALDGLPLSILGVAPRADIDAPVRRLAALSAAFGAAAILVGLLGTTVLLDRLTAPIRRLTRDARRAARARLAQGEGAEDGHGADEVAELASLFERLDRTTGELTAANALLEARNAEITEARGRLAASLGRLERELAAARDLQLGMVPAPERMDAIDPRLAVSAVMEPAREVGGDLYDVFTAGPDSCCFLIGDVADKGSASALFMARTLSILRFAAEQLSRGGAAVPRPSDVVERANDALCRRNHARMFVTLVFGTLDLRTGDIAYVNAGHGDPVLVGPGGVESLGAGAPDLPVAVRAGTRYRTHLAALRPGQSLLLYTDGVTEAEDERGRLLGLTRLRSVLARADRSPGGLVRAARAEVSRFAGAAKQSDDVTLLALGIRPMERGGA